MSDDTFSLFRTALLSVIAGALVAICWHLADITHALQAIVEKMP